MALRKLLSKRRFDGFGVGSPVAALEQSPILSRPPQTAVSPNTPLWNFRREYFTPSGSSDKGFFRRFLQRRAIYHSPGSPPELVSLPVGDKLREKLRDINITGGRLKLDGLAPPSPATVDSAYGISVADARKIMRISLVEKLKEKLRGVSKSSITYSEFLELCAEGCKDKNLGAEFAKLLDDSGNVIVLGNVVFLRPDQVAKSMETIISQSIAKPDDPRFRELEQMEREKSAIDEKAKALVRRELYCGLGFLSVQTLAFMRLTFWELSWDVMEPICFFVTSFHFALGYVFFLRTSTEPSFEGYFQRRFRAKQKKLMDLRNFDISRYNDLRKVCRPNADYVSSFACAGTGSLGMDLRRT